MLVSPAGVPTEMWGSFVSPACCKFHWVSPAGGLTVLKIDGLSSAGLNQGLYMHNNDKILEK